MEFERNLRRNFKIKTAFLDVLRDSEQATKALKLMSKIEDAIDPDKINEDIDEILSYTVINDANDVIIDEVQSNVDSFYWGVVDEIYDVWNSSIDKEAVEAMFKVFTGLNFEEFIAACKKKVCTDEQKEKIKRVNDLGREVFG